MSRTACERSWEAQAIADGRLSDSDRVSFERHAATCSVCERERAAVARLDERLRELRPAAADRIRRQRLRRRIIKSAGARARPHPGWYALPLVAALVSAVAFALHVRAPAAAKALPSASAVAVETLGPIYEIHNVRSAVWTVTTLGGVVRIALSAGEASFHVHKLRPDQRFLVSMPDGEIEVHGTRFTVLVEGHRTRSVHVTEGVVSLRLRDAAPRTLVASEHWNAEPERTAPTASSATTEAPSPPSHASNLTLPSARVTRSLPPAATTAATVPRPLVPAAAAAGADASAPAPASDDFVLGMSAFQRGDYSEADRLFASFAAHASSDARAEDAAYLRAVAHARMGDSAGAARLARAYLAAFPNGLRRREAEQLAAP